MQTLKSIGYHNMTLEELYEQAIQEDNELALELLRKMKEQLLHGYESDVKELITSSR